MNFLDDNHDDDDDNILKINHNYAGRYDKWRKDEELQKLKDKYGNNYDEGTSSTSEEEDEDAVELTDKIEKDFFKTLSSLKVKDPKIYDENVRFFEINKGEEKKVKKKADATLSMAAYKRKVLLETDGLIEEDTPLQADDMPLVQQEKLIKDSFKAALKDLDSDDEGVGGLFKTREKTQEEIAKEEDNYKSWLAGQKSAVPNSEEKELKGLRDYWNDPELDDGEKFLRDYILKQRYLEKDTKETTVLDLSESEDEVIKQQEEFERKFNFRFEEPDQDFIKRYPRTVEQSMRQKDDKRKKQRETLKTRKQAERAQKDEELKRLKALKRSEILDKIKKLQEVTGNEELAFQDNDIDGDFNPDEHDKRMSELFDQEFYEEQVDEEKPEFPELDEELEIEKWDEWQGNTEADENLHCEDPDFVMDCDYDPKAATQQELLESTKRRKKRRQSKFSVAVARPKPVFDPKNSSYEKYLDEYYSLNYEDLIGDIPCRFKYRKVVPNDFGLSIEEILSAPDKELNRWASVKKIMRRRPEHIEIYEQKAYQKKAYNITKKMQCIPSLYSTTLDDDDSHSNIDDTENSSTTNLKKGNELNTSSKSIKTSKKKNNGMAFTVTHHSSTEKTDKNEGKTIIKSKKIKNTTNKVTHEDTIEKTILTPLKSPTNVKNKECSMEIMVNNSDKSDKSLSTAFHGTTNVVKKKKIIKPNKSFEVSSESTIDSVKKPKKRTKSNNQSLNQPPPTISSKKAKLNDSGVTKKQKHFLNGSTANGAKCLKKKRMQKFNVNVKGKVPKRNTEARKDPYDDNPLSTLSDARLKSYGINPKKFKNKLKYGNK